MESMRRSEANSSHHPNKVAVNSLATESNKQSSGSDSTLNNNKLSLNNQQKIQNQQTLIAPQIQNNKEKHKPQSSSSNTSSITATTSSSGASSTSSESKDTNFEYDDNEWDVGGIGDLIIDLDADIEKSSSIAGATIVPQVTVVGAEATLSPLATTANPGSTNLSSSNSKLAKISILNAKEKSRISSTSSSSTNSSSTSSSPTTVSSSKSSNLSAETFSPISKVLAQVCNKTKSSSALSSNTGIKSTTLKQVKGTAVSSLAHQQPNLKLQQPALVAQLTGKPITALSTTSIESKLDSTNNSTVDNKIRQGNNNTWSSASVNLSTDPVLNASLVARQNQQSQIVASAAGVTPSAQITSMSSQPSGGQSAGKSATKMSIDHQATLDKGLKMKIKRTKPGTKTSEAKHEIVKAEQNGISNSLDDNNTSITPNAITNLLNSGSGKNKHTNQVNQQSPAVQSISAQSITASLSTTKRGNSGHRRDKTRDKTPHSRDKPENNNSSISASSGNSSSSSSHSNSSSSNDRSGSNSSVNNCNCVQEINGSGTAIQPPCGNASCIRIRTGSIGSLDHLQNTNNVTQRIAGSTANQTNSHNSTGSTSLTGNSASIGPNISSGVFSSNNSITNSQTSNTGAPNAPGPPIKESKLNVTVTSVNNNQQQSSIQIPNPTSLTANAQQQTIGLLPVIGCSSSNTQQSQQNISSNVKCIPSGLISATVHHTISVAANSTPGTSNSDDGTSSPPAKRVKSDSKDMVDICVGTSVGTITEPDCLGPCEPGTSVTLEGIVWHETEGGVLVVNVTWRGKTYVGTLLDCTRHDWAPPRFCDSPTEELDSRTPKGRGKRGRSANLTPDLSNFTETRSSVHSKLRNGGAKGRGGRGVTTGTTTATTTTPTTTTSATSGNINFTASSTSTITTITSSSIPVSSPIIGNVTSIANSSNSNNNTPSTSPTSFLPPRPEKRKSKDESLSPVNGESEAMSNINVNAITTASTTIALATQSAQMIVNPITGLNVQISNKKCKTASPCAISPVLLECPEQDCNKKYKHANGLRYHQSHAHGSGSMDEDSSTMPESPVRIAPPTTPSPVPPNTPQPLQETQTSTTVTILTNNNNCSSSVTGSGLAGNGPSPIMTTVSSPSLGIVASVPGVTSGPSPVVSVSTSGSGVLPSTSVISTNIGSPILAPITGQSHLQNSQHTIAGGSITAGISSQALSHQQQQHSMLVSTVPNQSILSGSNNQVIAENSNQQQSSLNQNQSNVSNVHNSLITSVRGDGPIKPGVLRFGPPPPIEISGNSNILPAQQSPIRPTLTAVMASNSGQTNTSESPHQQYGQSQSANQSGIPVNKSQIYGKQKKARKSPVPSEFDNSTSRDDVQSPAYSDISDDSTPVVEADITDKTPVKLPDVAKKPQELAPPQIPQLGGYGMYQFYAQQSYMVPPPQDHSTGSVPKQSQQLPLSNILPTDQYTKNKEPPLDLITKPSLSNDSAKDSGPPNVPQINISPQNTSKPMSHFYPFNYMPPGYPYNVDPNYGPVSMVSDENKVVGLGPNLPPPLKDDRTKESPSPHGVHDHNKISGQTPQMIPTKLIKSEPQMKEMKQEPNNSHSMHPKDQPVQSLGAYPGLYQRHPALGVPPQPPPQHISREDELRRYYIYSDQRRSNIANNPQSSLGNKDESHSSSLMHHQQQQQQQQLSQQIPQSQSQQQSGSQKVSKSNSQSNQKATNLIKDIKDEKDVKVKQEGQKPTMETQGPPPPPTSQYFLHPSYISPGPFGFDPTTHPMYRNVLMPTGPYNTPPYHLSMARFHAPEDLSRNPGTKALDVLHHAASQYYNNTHKIHELTERAMKSPNSAGGVSAGNNSSKTVNVSSPIISQQPGSGGGGNNLSGPNGSNSGSVGSNNGPGVPPNLMPSSGGSGGPLNMQSPPGSLSGIGGPVGPLSGSSGGNGPQKGDVSSKPGDSSGKNGNIGSVIGPPSNVGPGGVGPGGISGPGGPDSRSPPPQRHVHTHHHTHVGLGYPMYPAPYGAAVLASQQAAAVAVINPFSPGPSK